MSDQSFTIVVKEDGVFGEGLPSLPPEYSITINGVPFDPPGVVNVFAGDVVELIHDGDNNKENAWNRAMKGII